VLVHHPTPGAWLRRVSVVVGSVPRATVCPLGTASILSAQGWELCVVQEQPELSLCDLGRGHCHSPMSPPSAAWACTVVTILGHACHRVTRTWCLHRANPEPRNPRGAPRSMRAGWDPLPQFPLLPGREAGVLDARMGRRGRCSLSPHGRGRRGAGQCPLVSER